MNTQIPLNPLPFEDLGTLRKGGKINKATYFESPFIKGGVRRTGGLGFTLIETVVVVGVLAMIMVTITSLLVNSFRARSNVNTADTLEQNGSYILGEITSDFLNSYGGVAQCGPGGDTLTFKSVRDSEITTITCDDSLGRIASNSAVLNVGATVSGCENFVSCETDADNKVTAINIGFTLSVGEGVGDTGSRSFRTKVAARN